MVARARSQFSLNGAAAGRHAGRSRIVPTRRLNCGPLAASRAARGVLAVGVGLLVLGGCAPAGTAEPAPTLPAGVTVELVQLRADVAPRQAQVQITNGSGSALEIGDVRVEDPRFDGPATRVVEGRTSTIPAGGSVDVRVQLPAVDCTASSEGPSAGGGPEGGGTRVVLEVVGESGGVEIEASASDPLGFVAPLYDRECRRERLADAAALAFTGFEPSPPGEPAALGLAITPTGGGAATIVGVQMTNLLDFGAATVDGAYPLDLAIAPGDGAPVAVELPIVPSRCDPHAVQEDKRGTIFDVRVELDGEPGEIELFVGEELRGEILSWVATWCGFGG